jgi:hypothetical protein
MPFSYGVIHKEEKTDANIYSCSPLNPDEVIPCELPQEVALLTYSLNVPDSNLVRVTNYS